MKQSMRARRMARSHSRNKNGSKLNLVSLMDIFTILVFFLMVNNGDVEVLQADENIALPESRSEQSPDATLLIKITPTELSISGETVVLLNQIDGNAAVIEALATVLNDKATSLANGMESGLESGAQSDAGWSATIMADQDMPYHLLKQVLATCADSGFRDVSLAVNGQEAAGSSSLSTETVEV